MPQTEERIDAVEQEITGIRSDVRLQNAMLIKCGEQMSDLRTGQHELQKGQEELRTITAELRTGQDELRKGQDELLAITDELRKGQDELRADTAAIRQTLEEFRSAFAVVLDEIRIQKAWREEFSDKVARVIAKSEGLEA
ncbi:hypothetical protein IL992_13395 [Microbispora sp. NEAU-D428]|uniref:hypothetical protein n=1 Tax=Microbispora sitophila TaxID=2771537 RepID=UPI00186943B7|nr:hypothetical protein [Microbispora sitophila]MBE3010180.1 hypothetical protein [Microbispora sitophila]